MYSVHGFPSTQCTGTISPLMISKDSEVITINHVTCHSKSPGGYSKGLYSGQKSLYFPQPKFPVCLILPLFSQGFRVDFFQSIFHIDIISCFFKGFYSSVPGQFSCLSSEWEWSPCQHFHKLSLTLLSTTWKRLMMSSDGMVLYTGFITLVHVTSSDSSMSGKHSIDTMSYSRRPPSGQNFT